MEIWNRFGFLVSSFQEAGEKNNGTSIYLHMYTSVRMVRNWDLRVGGNGGWGSMVAQSRSSDTEVDVDNRSDE